MSATTDDTMPAGDGDAAEPSVDGDTVAAGDTPGRSQQPPARVRPSRPTLPQSSPNYPQLAVVDPSHYVIAREIARGGMGRVLVARDRRLGREVAVKEVLVHSGAVARRFEREARITARLQHPSIIAVHEAGTWPSGEPFYAMPLVTGKSLDEAIAAAQTYAERLALLPNVLAVADAMAYAHGLHVIHRDLKPRNVVVGEFGETVVLDWGLAKDLVTPELAESGVVPAAAAPAPGASSGGSTDGETSFGEVLGTPAYMPPEQAGGAASVDERADVYAIGAMLYQVLAGVAPYEGPTNAAILAALEAGPPRPLRAVVPDVASDLVAIVERAMARSRADRYPTARALAEDLRRFLNGQLVGAHRYSLRQLLRRWARKYRTALVATAVAALVAIAIGVYAIHRVVAAEQVAQAERAAAQQHQADAEELMRFMLGDLTEKLKTVGKLDLLAAVAERASAYYDEKGDPGNDDDRAFAAVARMGIGNVVEERGDLARALAEYTKAYDVLEALRLAHPGVESVEARALEAGVHVAEVRHLQGDLAGAAKLFGELRDRADRRARAAPDAKNVQHDEVIVHSHLGDILEQQGEPAKALVEQRLALAAAEREPLAADASTATHDAVLHDRLLAHAHVARLLAEANHDLDGALGEYRAALALGEEGNARDPRSPRWMRDVAISHDEVGSMLLRKGDSAGALADYKTGLDFAERAVTIDPTNTEAVSTRSTLAEKVGIALLARKDYAGARAAFLECADAWHRLGELDPTNVQFIRGASVIQNKLGDVALAQKDIPAALAYYRAGLPAREQLVARDPDNGGWRRDLFYSHYKLAAAYEAAQDLAGETAALRDAIAVADVTLAQHPTNDTYAADAGEAHASLGEELRAAGDGSGADAEFAVALAIAERMKATPGADLAAWTKHAARYAERRDARPSPPPPKKKP